MSKSAPAAARYVRFENGSVWPVSTEEFVDSVVAVELADVISHGLEGFLDLVADRAIGNELLQDISYSVSGSRDGAILLQVRGYVGDIIQAGQCAEATREDYLSQVLERYLPSEKSAGATYAHAMAASGEDYGAETVVKLHAGAELRCPSHPAPCSYVRVVAGGAELAYWNSDEMKDDPEDVLGALLGLARAVTA